jgi:hypothetical protein
LTAATVGADADVASFARPASFAITVTVAFADTITGAHEASLTRITRGAFDHFASSAKVVVIAFTLLVYTRSVTITVVSTDFNFTVLTSVSTDTIRITRIAMTSVVHAKTMGVAVEITFR